MIKCPNCGESHYVIHYSTTTALGWVQEYVDGKPMNSDPNITATHCTCCTCHHNFIYRTQYGEVLDITDEGETLTPPVVKMPINDTDLFGISAADLVIKTSEVKNSVTIPELERLEKKIDALTEKVNEILRGI